MIAQILFSVFWVWQTHVAWVALSSPDVRYVFNGQIKLSYASSSICCYSIESAFNSS